MLDRKVPIDGVGFQMHISGGYSDVAGVKANMERLGALGLDVHITELDISYNSWTQSSEQQQAQIYADILQACLDVPACKSFQTWGFTDKYTWMDTNKHPLPFDENFKPKAAVSSMIFVLLPTPSPPSPTPPSPTPPSPTRTYERLTQTCQNAKAITDKLSVGSVSECENLCDKQSGCNSLATNGSDCYLKSHCEGQVGQCSDWCGYRVKTVSSDVTIV